MIELRAHCKINLGLRVLRRRGDGFHDIATVMVAVPGLFDTVSVAAAGVASGLAVSEVSGLEVSAVSEVSGLEVSGPFGAALDCGADDNICMRALRLLQRECGAGEARVRLVKRVPFGAGLGGGSADAAAVLLAGNEEFGLELSQARLEELGARLGSDVAFFLRAAEAGAAGGRAGSGAGAGSGASFGSGSVAQLCTGRGEVMTPVEVDLSGRWIAIAKPPFGVSTAEAYAGVVPHEGREAVGGSGSESGDCPSLPEILLRPIAEWRKSLINDFETSVLQHYPQIATIKHAMYDAGAAYASMSGSGSAVFGIFDERPFGLDRILDGNFLHVSRLD